MQTFYFPQIELTGFPKPKKKSVPTPPKTHRLTIRLTDTQLENIKGLQTALGDVSATSVILQALREMGERLSD